MKHLPLASPTVYPAGNWVEIKAGELLQSTTDAAGFDLIYRGPDILVHPGERVKIPLQLVTQMSENLVGIVKEKSGLALKGWEVKAGVIDHDYPDPWAVIGRYAHQNGDVPVLVIKDGMKIAQVIFIQLPQLHLIGDGWRLESVQRTGGLGSTGVKA